MSMRDNEPLPEDRLYDEERDGTLAGERDTSVGPDSQTPGLRGRDPMLDSAASTDGGSLTDHDTASGRDVVAEPDALGNQGTSADRDTMADSSTTDAGIHTDDDVAAGRGGLSASDALSRDDIGSGTAETGTGMQGDRDPLVRPDLAMDLKTRWEVIQQGFVDNPRNAVSDADSLVDEVLQQLSSSFDAQQRKLESQWHEGEPSTEDLRSALQRYRAFFHRLLEV
jgi:hypothetical protein